MNNADVIDLTRFRRRATLARIEYLDDLADQVRAKADELRYELDLEPRQLALLDADTGA